MRGRSGQLGAAQLGDVMVVADGSGCEVGEGKTGQIGLFLNNF